MVGEATILLCSVACRLLGAAQPEFCFELWFVGPPFTRGRTCTPLSGPTEESLWIRASGAVVAALQHVTGAFLRHRSSARPPVTCQDVPKTCGRSGMKCIIDPFCGSMTPDEQYNSANPDSPSTPYTRAYSIIVGWVIRRKAE